jgi:hypothetical protein
MVRVKFLIFALLALGLGVIHLPRQSKLMGEHALDDAQAKAAAGTAEVVRTIEARRGIARALALKLAAHADLATAAQDMSGPEAPAVERFVPVRTAAEPLLPKELPGVVMGVVTQGGAWYVRAGSEPSSDAAALDLKALAQAEAPSVVEAFGAPHVFAAVPLVWRFVRTPGAEKVETQLAATLVVGVPLLADKALDTAATASGAAALGLLKADALVASGGASKDLIEQVRATLQAGQPAAVVRRGNLEVIGPLQLPLMLNGKDTLGGQAPLMVGTRRALEGTPYEVIALAGTQLREVAAYQHSTLVGLAGLLLLSLVWTALMGSSKKGSADDQVQGGDTLGIGSAMAAMAPPASESYPPAAPHARVTPEPLPLSSRSVPGAALAAQAAVDFPFSPPPPVQQAPVAVAAVPPAPPPEPFAFPPPPEAQPQPYDAQGYSAQPSGPFDSQPSEPYEPAQPFGSAPTPFDPLPSQPFADPNVSTASPRAGAFHFEELPTAAYSLQQAADPYAAAHATQEEEENPETTRVAAIPRELLQAAARPATQEVPLPAPYSTPPPAAPAVAPVPWTNETAPQAIPLPGAAYQQYLGNAGTNNFSEEEYHFQEVFREFVLTRERCNEPSDGLTYDKFVQKLRKNKDQLVQKYACRTVKFQVYVKEGKAALKATPVKD